MLFFPLQETLKIVQPILLGGLIQFFSPDSSMELWEGYMYAMGVGLSSIVPAAIFHVYIFAMTRNGMWMRIGICALVYKKVSGHPLDHFPYLSIYS